MADIWGVFLRGGGGGVWFAPQIFCLLMCLNEFLFQPRKKKIDEYIT